MTRLLSTWTRLRRALHELAYVGRCLELTTRLGRVHPELGRLHEAGVCTRWRWHHGPHRDEVKGWTWW